MYKLTVFDLLISIALLVLVEIPRRYKSLSECLSGAVDSNTLSKVFVLCVCVCARVRVRARMVVDNSSSKLAQMVGRQEFVVPSNVLGLVYGQTVVWVGAFFCPLLPLINTVKFIILFYCKKVNTSLQR